MLRPAEIDLAGDRFTPFQWTWRFPELDLTGADLKMEVRTDFDAPGDPLVALATVGAAVQGLRFSGYALDPADGRMKSTVEGLIGRPAMEAMPPAPQLGMDSLLAFDFKVEPPGFSEQLLIRGRFIVRGGVTRA